MATREVLQEGRRVIIDSKGNKTYAPFRVREDDEPTARVPTPRTLGTGTASAAAQAILDARVRREAAAEGREEYKRGGKVVAKKRPAAKSKPKSRR